MGSEFVDLSLTRQANALRPFFHEGIFLTEHTPEIEAEEVIAVLWGVVKEQEMSGLGGVGVGDGIFDAPVAKVSAMEILRVREVRLMNQHFDVQHQYPPAFQQ